MKFADVYNMWFFREHDTDQWEIIFRQRPDDAELPEEDYKNMLDEFYKFHKKERGFDIRKTGFNLSEEEADAWTLKLYDESMNIGPINTTGKAFPQTETDDLTTRLHAINFPAFPKSFLSKTVALFEKLFNNKLKLKEEKIMKFKLRRKRCKRKKVVVKTYPNKDVREYHVRFKNLPKSAIIEIFKIPGTIKGTCLTGGTYFTPEKYHLTVEKGVAFRWEEIEPRVLKILKRRYEKP